MPRDKRATPCTGGRRAFTLLRPLHSVTAKGDAIAPFKAITFVTTAP